MTAIDYLIIIVYMVVIVAVGLASRGRQESAQDYFSDGGVRGGFLGPVVVGLSIAATFFSGISFVAFPSLVFAEGTKVLIIFAALIPCLLVVPLWFIPRYMSFNGRSPYEIVAVRLGPKVRTATSALYTLLRLGWMASLIYAPTIVLLAMLGLGAEWKWPIILAVGLTSTVYATVSGLRGVIITDALQMIVILVSLFIAAWCGLREIPFEPLRWIEQLATAGKLTTPGWSLDPTERFTVWGVLIGISISNIATYVADQMSLQRYIAMGNVRYAQRSFIYNLIGVVIVLLLLLGLGMVILLWHIYNPSVAVPDNPDQVFPVYVITVLPMGLSGLMIAAILAATMSSITSGINALAGAITIDFVQQARPLKSSLYYLSVGRWLSMIIGVVATLSAGLAANLGTIFDVSQAILGVFIGPILGVVISAMMDRPVSQARSLAAIVCSCLAGISVVFSGAQTIWVTAVGVSVYMLIGLPIGSRRLEATLAESSEKA
jgi:SSS family solute:Na+ symporter